MNVQCFKDTGTLYIEARPVAIVKSRNLDEDTVTDLDVKAQRESSYSDLQPRGV